MQEQRLGSAFVLRVHWRPVLRAWVKNGAEKAISEEAELEERDSDQLEQPLPSGIREKYGKRGGMFRLHRQLV